MYLELFFFILFLGVYFLCYVEMKIHKENEIHVFDRELTRSNVHKETFVKLPFLLDGKHLNEAISKSSLQVIEKKKSFVKYEKDAPRDPRAVDSQDTLPFFPFLELS